MKNNQKKWNMAVSALLDMSTLKDIQKKNIMEILNLSRKIKLKINELEADLAYIDNTENLQTAKNDIDEIIVAIASLTTPKEIMMNYVFDKFFNMTIYDHSDKKIKEQIKKMTEFT